MMLLSFPSVSFKEKKYDSLEVYGTPLAVQWLRFHASSAVGGVRSLVRELRSHVLRGMAKKLLLKSKEIYLPPCPHL